MPPIPEGLSVARDPSGKGLLASWWGVQLAHVESNPEVPGGLVVVALAAPSAFTHEGIGTLNGWLPVAGPDDLRQALGEPTEQEQWEAHLGQVSDADTGTCWCGQTIYRTNVDGQWHHREALGHEARPA